MKEPLSEPPSCAKESVSVVVPPRASGAVPPLARQQRVDDLALPLALDPLVLDEVRLVTHPELLEDAGGATVARLEASDHAVQADDLEGKGEQRPRRLRRVAVSVMCAVEDEAELALAMWDARPEQRDVADELF